MTEGLEMLPMDIMTTETRVPQAKMSELADAFIALPGKPDINHV